MRIARRSLLACLPVALAPVGARAFRLEELSDEAAAEYQEAACPRAALYDTSQAGPVTVASDLPDETAPPRAAPARCPFCGCAVAGAADHGEQAPAPPG